MSGSDFDDTFALARERDQWKARYERLRSIIDTLAARHEIPAIAFMSNIGGREKAIQHELASVARGMAAQLVEGEAFQIATANRLDGGVDALVKILVVRDMATLASLDAAYEEDTRDDG